jgi:hypothetical protein
LKPGNAGGGKDPDFWYAFEEGGMRKQISFAVAATMLVLAAAFWLKSGGMATSAQISHPNLSGTAGSFLPVRTLEPMW